MPGYDSLENTEKNMEKSKYIINIMIGYYLKDIIQMEKKMEGEKNIMKKVN